MSRLAGCLCLLLAGALPALAAPKARDPSASLDACIAALDSLDIGYERIAERCPGLTSALEASDEALWLPADWKRPGNELSAAGLAQLRVLLMRERAVARGARRADVAQLPVVLAQLGPVEPPSSWRTRLAGWLRGREPPSATSGRVSGLVDWIGPGGSPPAALTHLLLALAVVLAVLLAGRELLLAGGLRRFELHGWRIARHRPAPAAQAQAGRLAAPLGERPALLLVAITARLREEGRVPAPQALTARELAALARLPPVQREQLASLGQVAEQLRFAPVPPAGGQITAALEQGQQLLASLATREDM
jgi:hypothetical protein